MRISIDLKHRPLRCVLPGYFAPLLSHSNPVARIAHTVCTLYVLNTAIRYPLTPSILRLFVRDSINARLKSHVCHNRHFFTPQDTNPVVGSSTKRVEMNVLRVNFRLLRELARSYHTCVGLNGKQLKSTWQESRQD